MMNPLKYVAPIVTGALCLGMGAGLVIGLNRQHTEPVHIVYAATPVPNVTIRSDLLDSVPEDATEKAAQIAWSLDHQPGEWSSPTSDDDVSMLCRGEVCVWFYLGPDNVRVGRNFEETVNSGPGSIAWIPNELGRQLIWNAAERWKTARAPKPLQASDIHP